MMKALLSKEYVQSLKEILNQQGINAVDEVYKALMNRGYNYASWAMTLQLRIYK